MGHIEIKSASGKAILGMDAVAVGVLLAAFILGEVATVAEGLNLVYPLRDEYLT